MLVPSSFKYSSSPERDTCCEKQPLRAKTRRTVPSRSVPTPTSKSERPPGPVSKTERPVSPIRTATEPASKSSDPVGIPMRSNSGGPQAIQTLKSRGQHAGRQRERPRDSRHRPDALPPAVAALLAVTAIPRPRPNQFRRLPTSNPRRMSIDELVQEWKSDEKLKSSYSSSSSLNVLLEQGGQEEEGEGYDASSQEHAIIVTRSTSSESIPSLDADDRSTLSNGSPSTPGSPRSQKSSGNFSRREKARSLPNTKNCMNDHPLVKPPPAKDEAPADLLTLPPRKHSVTPKSKASFKSNLTSSLQALKAAALSSISTLTNSPNPAPTSSLPSWSDATLWSRPFLFPRFSPEVRPPPSQGTPNSAERRYLNRTPLTFEEQEAPFRQALHATRPDALILDVEESAPMIQMQTYNRGRRKSRRNQSPRPGSTDPNSEAGRNLAAAAGSVRQREPRENSDFLRVVVLEMNMRREGKLETGRARIWLPPREATSSPGEEKAGVPRRWVGVSAC